MKNYFFRMEMKEDFTPFFADFVSSNISILALILDLKIAQILQGRLSLSHQQATCKHNKIKIDTVSIQDNQSSKNTIEFFFVFHDRKRKHLRSLEEQKM